MYTYEINISVFTTIGPAPYRHLALAKLESNMTDEMALAVFGDWRNRFPDPQYHLMLYRVPGLSRVIIATSPSL